MEVTLKSNEQRKLRRRRKWKENLTGYLFIAPNLIGFLVFVFIPVLVSLFISFTNWDVTKGFSGAKIVGISNYTGLLSDDWFKASLKNNLAYTLVTIPVILGLSIVIATVLNNKVYFKNAIRAMFFLPYIASIVSIGVVWMMLYNPSQGLINQLLRDIGISNPPLWLASMKSALPAIMIMGVWMQIGYSTVVYMSGLQGIDTSLYESADIDGANWLRKFFKITVPMLSPTTFFLLITNIITSFQVFALISILTGGGPGTSTTMIAYYIYLLGFRYYKMGNACAVAWVLLAIVFCVTLFQWKGQKKWVNY